MDGIVAHRGRPEARWSVWGVLPSVRRCSRGSMVSRSSIAPAVSPAAIARSCSPMRAPTSSRSKHPTAIRCGGGRPPVPISAAHDGALFRFLHCSNVPRGAAHRRARRVGRSGDRVRRRRSTRRRPRRDPALVVLSITPFGRGGPFTNRPATEFTVQAEAGSATARLPSRSRFTPRVASPSTIGRRSPPWVRSPPCGGRAARGRGEHVDVSLHGSDDHRPQHVCRSRLSTLG